MTSKRILSLILSFTLILQSFSLVANATPTISVKTIDVNGINVSIIQDDEYFKTTRSSDNEGIYEWNLNKKSHQLIYRKFDPKTKEMIEEKYITPSKNRLDFSSVNKSNPIISSKSRSRITRHENTLVNYEYGPM